MKRIITLIATLLMGCQSTQPYPITESNIPLNSKWLLQHTPNATLDLTKIPKACAYAGCNPITLTINDFGDGQMQISSLNATHTVCPYMKLEQKFTEFLPTIQYYVIHGNTLTLFNDAGEKMVFIHDNNK